MKKDIRYYEFEPATHNTKNVIDETYTYYELNRIKQLIYYIIATLTFVLVLIMYMYIKLLNNI
jgi:hypothetical protein